MVNLLKLSFPVIFRTIVVRDKILEIYGEQ